MTKAGICVKMYASSERRIFRMKKKWIRMISAFMVFTMLFGSVVNVAATSTDQPADAASSDDMASDRQTDTGILPAWD